MSESSCETEGSDDVKSGFREDEFSVEKIPLKCVCTCIYVCVCASVWTGIVLYAGEGRLTDRVTTEFPWS